MRTRKWKTLIGWSVGAVLTLGPGSAPIVWAAPATVYSSIPGSVPADVASQGFEFSTVTEVGDHVVLGPGPRLLSSVQVILSSWACEHGRWYSWRCASTVGATFSHPITVTIYAVDDSGPAPVPGAVVATKTQTFDLPYRPSADPVKCPTATSRWYEPATGACHLGYAFPVTLDFSADGVTLPDSVIWTVSFDTTHFGRVPLGEATACYSAAEPNCPYDALHVGMQTFTGAPFAGTDADPYGIFVSYANEFGYCDATGPAGVLRLDSAHPASPDSFACLDGDTAWLDGKPLAAIVTEGAATGPDRFACYDVRTSRPRRDPWTVALASTLGSFTVTVDAPKLHCVPTDRDGDGIVDPARRLTCYGLRERQSLGGTLTVEDEDGTQSLALRHRSLLCVPSAPAGGAPAASLDAYALDAVSGGTRPDRIAVLADAYGAGTVRVQRSVWVGVAASIEGATVADPAAALVCDKLAGGALADAALEVADRFGTRALTLGRAEALCLPAKVVPQ